MRLWRGQSTAKRSYQRNRQSVQPPELTGILKKKRKNSYIITIIKRELNVKSFLCVPRITKDESYSTSSSLRKTLTEGKP